ncbi:MAG: hypothetical protein R3B45_12990 [Bdellovibrionota bacterium]
MAESSLIAIGLYKFLNIRLVILPLLFFSISCYAATLSQLGNKTIVELTEVIKSMGVVESASIKLASDMKVSIERLEALQEPPSYVRQILDSEIESNKMGDLISRLFRAVETLAPREKVVLCGQCITGELSGVGITNIPVVIKGNHSLSQYAIQMPKDRSAIIRSINNYARSLKVSDLTNLKSRFAVANLDTAVDLRSYYLSLTRMKSGSADDRAFAEQLLKFGEKKNGVITINNTELWRLLSDPSVSIEDIKLFTFFLKKVNDTGSAFNSRRQLLQKEFESLSTLGDEAKQAFENLKVKNCWKIF